MMEHKGADTKARINAETFEVGQKIALELGDWNGVGFSYKQNGNAKFNAVVVDVESGHIKLVKSDDRAEWNLSPIQENSEAFEFKVSSDGDVEGLDFGGWNVALKSFEKVGEPEAYTVQNGVERAGYSGTPDDNKARCMDCGNVIRSAGAMSQTPKRCTNCVQERIND